MTGQELRDILAPALERLADASDELRKLDADLGDGDLGITVTAGTQAAREALTELSDDVTPAELLRALAPRFASANPSTFAALVAGGLLGAAKAVGDSGEMDREGTLVLGRAAADAIATRGKSTRGDKTVLDALLPSLDALEGAPSDPSQALETMVQAAQRGVHDTTALRSQKGRAAWLQERSEGRPDPGAVAYLRFLEALREAWPENGRGRGT